ncbi:hypothetical protein [Saprospira grandis]|uniref:Uncharacterized protein n=1 Tax=Saprospira grandis (strain Lewin) TaxID=984262 RepID=H6L4K8_SAPGL|nr:hypothetical protein [Saprospira grandis]AFC23932.1 hypothetical protein SGRA_1197 [Saprospira grandis str. Lewin]
MISLIILIGVIRNYWNLAKAKGKNAYLWAFLAFIIYYGLVILISVPLMFFLEEQITGEPGFELLFNLVIGFLSLLFTYLLGPVLIKDDKALSLEEQNDILDAGL